LAKVKEPELLSNTSKRTDTSKQEQMSDTSKLSDISQSVSAGISKAMQLLQSSYTKAFNKKYSRHGSLFQSRFRAKLIDHTSYLLQVVTYIHQNPVRSNLTETPESWEFLSYRDYIDLRRGSLPKKEFIFSTISQRDLINFTNTPINHIEKRYWI
jgi:hypothetical protein